MFLNLLISLCSVVYAGDTLDVATVSAQRDAAAASISPLQSISAAKAERLGTIGLHEAVKHMSGVSVKDYGGVGGLKTVSVRNMGASHTAVIYDGIAISNAQNGQVDISRFNLDNISSTTLSIGLDNELFSSARHLTAAGTLYIRSDEPVYGRKGIETSVRMTMGSFNTYNQYVSIRQAIGKKYFLSVSANGTYSKGDYPFSLQNGNLVTLERRKNSDVGLFGCEADLRADWDTKGRIKFKINYHGSERGIPGSVILYTNKNYERLWDKSLISNLMYDLNIGQKWSFHADGGYNYSYNRHLDSSPAYPKPQDSRYAQGEYTLAARAMYRPDHYWSLVLAEDCFVNTLDSNIPECPFPVRFSSITALSSQYSREQITIRASLVATAMREWLQTDGSTNNRTRLSPMLGLSWNFSKGMYLRAGYKEGFRMPTFNDLYYARVGNVNLRPETARQINLGLTCTSVAGWGNCGGSIDFYCNQINDKITAVPTMFIWKMQNIGKALMYGSDISIYGTTKLNEHIRLHWSGSYSLQYAIDITDPDQKNYKHQIPYTPRHSGNGHITLELPWLNLTYRGIYTGKRYIKGQNIPANELKGYADQSISINRSFDFGKNSQYKVLLSAEALNLSDVNYEIINYYPMPGRQFRLTVKISHISN